MNIVYIIVLSIIGIATILSIITLIKSKLAVEKMVSVDVITTITTGALLLFSMIFSSSFILDIAIIYAILSFGAVFIIARYRERGI